jgi:acetylornithine deacetylase/succinyl-diaminopimelate desuccinylase-like protein
VHEDLRSAVDELTPSLRADLERMVAIPSVSAAGFDSDRVRESADLTARLLEAAGCEGVRLLEIDGAHPAVFGEIPGPEGAPTVLLYAHHDVQPPGPADEWDTPPFEPTERGGRLYGRGVADDKGGIAVHIGAITAHGGTPPVHVKVFVEGEEEIGSGHLGQFIEEHGTLLAADVIVIADSANLRTGQPSLTTSLRGLVDCVVEVRTLRQAMHSGVFGGPFPDALITLSRLIATLHDDGGEVAVPGLVTGDAEPVDLTEEELRSQVGAVDGLELIGNGPLTARLWNKPSISVLAIDAPPVAEAINQLVPVARAVVSMRLAPGDDPSRALQALSDHLVTNTPWGAEITVAPGAKGEAFAMETSGPAFDAFRSAFAEAWATDVLEIGMGGSIPFVSAFQNAYPSASVLLTGVADDRSWEHGPNESVDLGDLRRGVLAEAIALRLLAG